jgi:hypothetical protein
MKSILLKALPHVIAIVLFAVISSVYFSPINDGYSLKQHDIEQWRGMSKEIADYRLVNGEEPLWTNSMFGGMPSYQISTVHESNLLRYVDQVYKLGMQGPIGVMFIAMLGFYIFALCVRVNPWVGIIGGIGFGLATINILYLGAGHVSKVNAIAYMAPALGGLLLATRGKWILGSAIFALFFALNISANHLQMTYYLAFLLGAVALTEGIRLIVEKQFKYLVKVTAALAIAAVIGILPAMSNLLTTYEYSKFTTRGTSELTIEADGSEKKATDIQGLDTDYILEYNFGKGEVWSLYLPNAKGGQTGAIGEDKELLQSIPREYREQIGQSNRYWGEQRFTGGAFYFGAIIMFLFVLGMIFIKDWIKWPFLVLFIIAIGLAGNDPGGINDFFISKFPLYNKFRDSKMILSIIQVMASAIAVLLVDRLIKGEGIIGGRKSFLIGTGALVLVAIMLVASPAITGDLIAPENKQVEDAYLELEKMEPNSAEYKQLEAGIRNYEQVLPELENVRATIFKDDASRSLMFVIVAAVLVVLTYLKKIPGLAMAGGIAVMVLFDQYGVCQRYLNENMEKGKFKYYVKASEKVIPMKPATSDLSIMETERPMAKDFDKTYNTLLSAMNNNAEYAEVKDKELVKSIAEFGALGLTTDFRVAALGNPFSDANTSYLHKSIGGYHGAKLKRYQEMIEFHIQPELKLLADSLKSIQDLSILKEMTVLNMLNTRYFIYNPEAPALSNPYSAGNAWFVNEIATANSANEEITMVKGLDYMNKAVVSKEFADRVKNASAPIDSTSNISLIEYHTNKLVYQSNCNADAPVIFSEIYYPAGWTCSIDGKPASDFRANYIFRGVMVPAGEHTIEWVYSPESFKKGSTYSLAGSLLLFALVLGALAVEGKKIFSKG